MYYYICHHGIKGMHWGVRRFQPYPDGVKNKGKEIGEAAKKKTNEVKNSIHDYYHDDKGNLYKKKVAKTVAIGVAAAVAIAGGVYGAKKLNTIATNGLTKFKKDFGSSNIGSSNIGGSIKLKDLGNSSGNKGKTAQEIKVRNTLYRSKIYLDRKYGRTFTKQQMDNFTVDQLLQMIPENEWSRMRGVGKGTLQQIKELASK